LINKNFYTLFSFELINIFNIYFFNSYALSFNLYDIYPNYIAESNTIKIIHKTYNSNNKTLCVFGVLENEFGKKIEEEMLKWLLPNYDLYIVYQKYPGKLYEYPALKFAQYLINKKNKTLLLYLHSKGAFFPNRDKGIQKVVRELWKYEYSGNNIKKYINPILNNIADVTAMFVGNCCKATWFNGFYISYRAFNIINLDKLLNTTRWKYEVLFNNTNASVLGIIENKVDNNIHDMARKYLELIKKIKIDDLLKKNKN